MIYVYYALSRLLQVEGQVDVSTNVVGGSSIEHVADEGCYRIQTKTDVEKVVSNKPLLGAVMLKEIV